jgi:hypothetical protein
MLEYARREAGALTDPTCRYEIFRFDDSIKENVIMSWSLTLDILWFMVRLLFWVGLGVAVLTIASKLMSDKKDSDDIK